MCKEDIVAEIQKYGIPSDPPIPQSSSIKHIHLYDFDNTLFKSPQPNSNLFTSSACNLLCDSKKIISGGWWRDPRPILRAGNGFESETLNGWKGWWNENIVDLARKSSSDKNTFSVLLTGRQKDLFSDIISKILISKDLHFDMVVLKPTPIQPQNISKSSISNLIPPKPIETKIYKDYYTKLLLSYFTNAQSLVMYEDREWQANYFTTSLSSYAKLLNEERIKQNNSCPILTIDIVLVPSISMSLRVPIELQLIKETIQSQNQYVAKNIDSSLSKKKRNLLMQYLSLVPIKRKPVYRIDDKFKPYLLDLFNRFTQTSGLSYLNVVTEILIDGCPSLQNITIDTTNNIQTLTDIKIVSIARYMGSVWIALFYIPLLNKSFPSIVGIENYKIDVDFAIIKHQITIPSDSNEPLSAYIYEPTYYDIIQSINPIKEE